MSYSSSNNSNSRNRNKTRNDDVEIFEIISESLFLPNNDACLKKIIVGLCSFIVFLVICIQVNPCTHIGYTPTIATTITTPTTTTTTTTITLLTAMTTIPTDDGYESAINDNQNIVRMTNGDLTALQEVAYNNGTLRFQVNGYGRSSDRTQLILVVDGGSTIVYDQTGIITAATGTAAKLLLLQHEQMAIHQEGTTSGKNAIPSPIRTSYTRKRM